MKANKLLSKYSSRNPINIILSTRSQTQNRHAMSDFIRPVIFNQYAKPAQLMWLWLSIEPRNKKSMSDSQSGYMPRLQA